MQICWTYRIFSDVHPANVAAGFHAEPTSLHLFFIDAARWRGAWNVRILCCEGGVEKVPELMRFDARTRTQ
jgi:hypothetical protein